LDAAQDNELSIGALNAHNLSRGIEQQRLAALVSLIASGLPELDLLLLTEVQDDSAERDDGVVSAAQTLQWFCDELVSAGAPRYDWLQIDPKDGQDGGQPGANIRQVFLWNGARGLSVVAGSQSQPSNPRRIDASNVAFDASRKPLLAEFSFAGERLTFIGNHFVAKTRDDPALGRYQPPILVSSEQRRAQSAVVAAGVSGLLQSNPNAHVIVLGDLNDTHASAALRPLWDIGLHSLLGDLPAQDRYSYVFEGNAQALDQVFVSQQLRQRVVGFGVLHVNADFARASSDHDPLVLRLAF
jgi:predicted extracellular nuclease